MGQETEQSPKNVRISETLPYPAFRQQTPLFRFLKLFLEIYLSLLEGIARKTFNKITQILQENRLISLAIFWRIKSVNRVILAL